MSYVGIVEAKGGVTELLVDKAVLGGVAVVAHGHTLLLRERLVLVDKVAVLVVELGEPLAESNGVNAKTQRLVAAKLGAGANVVTVEVVCELLRLALLRLQIGHVGLLLVVQLKDGVVLARLVANGDLLETMLAQVHAIYETQTKSRRVRSKPVFCMANRKSSAQCEKKSSCRVDC